MPSDFELAEYYFMWGGTDENLEESEKKEGQENEGGAHEDERDSE